jgi:DNA helicase II / ATP-dependent DNA helicase PcrA
LAGLEEERRLAYVGLTRARHRAKVSFAQNRRNRGLYQSATPSRFVDELPEDHIHVIEAKSPFGGAYANFGDAGAFGRRNPFGPSRFDEAETAFGSSYATPGWQRARQQWNQQTTPPRRSPLTLDGELVASSTGHNSQFNVGDRVVHQRFGAGTVTHVDGNKLTIEFESAGRKRVVDSFVEPG